MESYEEYARRAKLMTCIHAPKASATASADGSEPKGKDSTTPPNRENIENGEGGNSAASTGIIKRKASMKSKALLDHKKAVKKRGLRRL